MNDIEILIEKLHLKKAKVRGNELWCLCPSHSDTIANNFSLNLNTGKCFCFACGFSSSVIQLAFQNNTGYDEAYKIWNIVRRGKEDFYLPATPVDNYLLKYYKKLGYSNIALERTKSELSLNLYNVYRDEKDNPVYFINNESNTTMAILVKYKNYDIPILPVSWKIDGLFVGLHLPSTEYTIVVEGLWDAMYCHQYTGYKSVAIGGTILTEAQIKTLERLSPVIFLFDGDERGREARDRTHWLLKYNKNVISYYCGNYFADPDDLLPEKLLDVIKNKKDWFQYQEWRK